MIPRDHAFARRILGLVPINSLDPRLQDQVLARGELLEFRRRKTVFEAGARDPFTFYLLDGELELAADGASPLRMRPGDENARRALAQLQPRRYTAVAMTPVTLFRIERDVLDHILSAGQIADDATGSMHVREIETEDHDDWMTRLLSSALFTRLPHDNIQRFFTELEPIEAADGEVIVEQGARGEFLYIVAEGRCEVVRRATGAAQEMRLALLREGDSFGEEALISNSPRNASVRMLCDGMLMRLPKHAFQELVSNPTLRAVPWSEACKLAEDGALWLDVRFPDEHQGSAVKDSINAPLNVLRLQAPKLDATARYIVYCDSGARSSAGAFLLAQLGFDACYLAGGIERTPLGQGLTPAAVHETEPETSAEPEPPTPAAGGDAAAEFEVVAASPDAVPETVGPVHDAGAGETTGEPVSPAAPVDAGRVDDRQDEPESTAALGQPAAPRPAGFQMAPADLARVRQVLAQLRDERDKAIAYGTKAANAARELKRRNDEFVKVFGEERERRERLGKELGEERDRRERLDQELGEERARREHLDQELGAARADAARADSLEQTRLRGELEKSVKRLDALQRERADEQQRLAAEREQLEGRVTEGEERLRILAQEKDEALAARAATEAALDGSLRETREESARLAQSLQSLQHEHDAAREELAATHEELATTREQLVRAEALSRDAARSRDTLESERAAAVREAEAKVEAASQRLEEERARFGEQLEQLERAQRERDAEQSRLRIERDEEESRLRLERAELETALAAQRVHAEELDQRETELTEARNNVDAQLDEREAALDQRAQQLSQDEQALSGEKAAWKDTVEKAIAEERTRLAAEYQRYREETEANVEQRAEELAEGRLEEQLAARTETLRAEHEAREAEMRSQVEAHVAKLLAEVDQRLGTVRTSHEAKMLENEAMFEDERQRLEAEIGRLRSALASARKVPEPRQAAPTLPTTRAAATPALDVHLETGATIVGARENPQSKAATNNATPVPDLDLQIDESELLSATAQTPEAPAEAPAVPLIELPEAQVRQAGAPQAETSDAQEAKATQPAEEKTQRVIAAEQLAEIRKRMQEKMRAAKSRAG